MSWVILAIICMFMTVAKTFLAKHLLRSLSVDHFVFYDLFFSLLLITCLFPYFNFDQVNLQYIATLIFVCAPVIVGLTFLSKATQTGEVSEVAPLLVTIPALSAVTAPFITGEQVSSHGAIGIIIVLIGAYLLKLEHIKDLLSPFRALFREKAMKYLAITIGLGIINIHLQKLLIDQSNSQTMLFLQQSILTMFALPMAIRKSDSCRHLFAPAHHHWPLVTALAIITSISSLSLYMAIEFGGQVPYVLSIKRLSIVLIAGIGMISLKESFRTFKVLGISMMVVGCLVLIATDHSSKPAKVALETPQNSQSLPTTKNFSAKAIPQQKGP